MEAEANELLDAAPRRWRHPKPDPKPPSSSCLSRSHIGEVEEPVVLGVGGTTPNTLLFVIVWQHEDVIDAKEVRVANAAWWGMEH
jgi:hypothetical protein